MYLAPSLFVLKPYDISPQNKPNVVVMKSLNAIWDSCLSTIREKVNQQSFRTWFEPIKPARLDNNVLTIQVPSHFFYEWLEEHYVSLLRDTIQDELGPNARLEYQIMIDRNAYSPKNSDNGSMLHNNSTYYHGAPPAPKEAITKNKNADLMHGIGFNPFVIPGIKEFDPQLKPEYTFETFIEGECNQLARSAGIAVAKNPGGTAFNPLVLYGGVGLGKTHLGHAIGNYVYENHRDKKILYVTAERFTNQFIDAVKNGSINEFSNFYQVIDLLIVDDITFFAGKERTQDIFFHIFNTLHQSGKQIVLTSDRPPKDLQDIEDRLMSRFKWGLSADLQVPDLETRIAIMERKLQVNNIEVSREVIEYVAYHVNTNIREMEGILISLLAHSSLNNREINVELAKNTLKNFIKSVSQQITIDIIHRVVCEYFKLPTESLKGSSRKREIAQARQIAMYISKKFTDKSLKAIGGYFGGRDHTTVIHACNAILNLMETDKSVQVSVIDIEKQLNLNS